MIGEWIIAVFMQSHVIAVGFRLKAFKTRASFIKYSHEST